MLRTEKPVQSADAMRDARLAVSTIQRLIRGNHLAVSFVEGTQDIAQVMVDEFGHQVMASIKVASEITGLRGSAKHLYRVKHSGAYNRDGSRVTDSLQYVLLNKAFFNQAFGLTMPKVAVAS